MATVALSQRENLWPSGREIILTHHLCYLRIPLGQGISQMCDCSLLRPLRTEKKGDATVVDMLSEGFYSNKVCLTLQD